MLYNIPCRSNPMPYYSGSIDYSTLPMTYECVSGSNTVSFPLYKERNKQSQSTWVGSNSLFKDSNYNLYYRKNNGNWVDWKAQGFTEVELSAKLKIEISGTNPGQICRSWGGYTNRFEVGGTGRSIIYGNLSSIFASNVTTVVLNNLFLGPYNSQPASTLIDASKLIVSYSTKSNEGLNLFGMNYSLVKGPLLFNTNYVAGMYAYCFLQCGNLSCLEVNFSYSNNWSFANCFNNVNTTGIFIKPQNTYLPSKGINTIPSNWTVLNRINGKLYYAEAIDGHSVGDQYTGEDPYAWYYK